MYTTYIIIISLLVYTINFIIISHCWCALPTSSLYHTDICWCTLHTSSLYHTNICWCALPTSLYHTVCWCTLPTSSLYRTVGEHYLHYYITLISAGVHYLHHHYVIHTIFGSTRQRQIHVFRMCITAVYSDSHLLPQTTHISTHTHTLTQTSVATKARAHTRTH